MKKNCPHCGGVNEDVQFCVNCGIDISELFSAEAIERKKQEEAQAQEKEAEERQSRETHEEMLQRKRVEHEQASYQQKEAEKEALRRQQWELLQKREQEDILSDEIFNLWNASDVSSVLNFICLIFPILGIFLGTLIMLTPMFESKKVGAKCVKLSAKALGIHVIIAVLAFFFIVLPVLLQIFA